MRDQVEERADEAVDEHLLDGGYVRLESIDRAAADCVDLYMPVPEPKKEGVDRYAEAGRQRGGGGVAAADGHRRGEGDVPQRGSTIETINGDLKTHRGLLPVLVRGPAKVRCMALWAAMAYNIVQLGAYLLDG